MKKNMFLVIFICFTMLFSVAAYAQDYTKYQEVVDKLIKEYGISYVDYDKSKTESYGSWTKGLHYGELIDMDGDGKKEMILIYVKEDGGSITLDVYGKPEKDLVCLVHEEILPNIELSFARDVLGEKKRIYISLSGARHCYSDKTYILSSNFSEVHEMYTDYDYDKEYDDRMIYYEVRNGINVQISEQEANVFAAKYGEKLDENDPQKYAHLYKELLYVGEYANPRFGYEEGKQKEGLDSFLKELKPESIISQEEREKRTIIFAQSLYDSMKLKDSISELEKQLKQDFFNIETMREIEVVNTYNRVYLDIADAALDSAVTTMKIATGDYGEAYDAIDKVGKEIEKGLVKDGFVDVATATMDVNDYVYSTAETAFYKQNNTYVGFIKCITDIRKEGMTYSNAVEFIALYSEFYINSAGICLGFEYFNNQMPHNNGETIIMVLQSLGKEGFLILGDEVLTKVNVKGEFGIFVIDMGLEIFNANSDKYDPAFAHYAEKINRLLKATSNIIHP